MRILAGAFKGRKLLPPPGTNITRPITGGAKKSLFDMLADLPVGRTALDLYCGTGTLGLEALSRGAARCFFADRDPAALDRLRRNIEAVAAAGRCTVWRGDVAKHLATWLQDVNDRVAVAFVDPPFAEVRRWDWAETARLVFDPLAEGLATDGLVVIRTPARLELPDPLGSLEIRRAKRYGGMMITMYGLTDPGGEQRK